jgi:hypothetical protein
MRIILKRSFPWFPVVLAAGWVLMMSLAIPELEWFAATSASLGRSVTSAAKAVSPATAAVKVPILAAPCRAAALAPDSAAVSAR